MHVIRDHQTQQQQFLEHFDYGGGARQGMMTSCHVEHAHYKSHGVQMVEPTLDVAGDSFANDSECEDEVDFVPSPWGWLFPQKGGYVAQSRLNPFS